MKRLANNNNNNTTLNETKINKLRTSIRQKYIIEYRTRIFQLHHEHHRLATKTTTITTTNNQSQYSNLSNSSTTTNKLYSMSNNTNSDGNIQLLNICARQLKQTQQILYQIQADNINNINNNNNIHQQIDRLIDIIISMQDTDIIRYIDNYQSSYSNNNNNNNKQIIQSSQLQLLLQALQLLSRYSQYITQQQQQQQQQYHCTIQQQQHLIMTYYYDYAYKLIAKIYQYNNINNNNNNNNNMMIRLLSCSMKYISIIIHKQSVTCLEQSIITRATYMLQILYQQYTSNTSKNATTVKQQQQYDILITLITKVTWVHNNYLSVLCKQHQKFTQQCQQQQQYTTIGESITYQSLQCLFKIVCRVLSSLLIVALQQQQQSSYYHQYINVYQEYMQRINNIHQRISHYNHSNNNQQKGQWKQYEQPQLLQTQYQNIGEIVIIQIINKYMRYIVDQGIPYSRIICYSNLHSTIMNIIYNAIKFQTHSQQCMRKYNQKYNIKDILVNSRLSAYLITCAYVNQQLREQTVFIIEYLRKYYGIDLDTQCNLKISVLTLQASDNQQHRNNQHPEDFVS